MIFSLILGVILVNFVYFYFVLTVKPKVLRLKIAKQGIYGPTPSFLLGNIPEMKIQLQIQSSKVKSDENHRQDHQDRVSIVHDWPSTLFPHLKKWINEYDMEIVKEISMFTSLELGKPSYLSTDRGPLLGRGILSSSGPIWAHQRKIITPEFSIDKVKGMVELMVDSTISMLRSWETRIESDGGMADIRVDNDMRSLSADIISRACFGSSYSRGEEIFSNLRILQHKMSKASVGIPGFRFLPTKNNRDIWKLEKEIHSMILNVVKQRVEGTYEKDFMQSILEGAKSYVDDGGLSSSGLSIDKFIVDNCKNIYFAGHETTAITISWSLVLLAAHPEWQARARAEVLEICGDKLPNADMLRTMKTLTMVVQETLRLYPPAVSVIREALEDIKLKDILIPKGMGIQIPISILQHHPDLWGDDANEFNPGRFTNGILKACKIPQAYIPFGVGARTCVGQQLALTEVKLVLSLILSKFSFSLSPAYKHSPAFKLVVEPGQGVNLLVRKM